MTRRAVFITVAATALVSSRANADEHHMRISEIFLATDSGDDATQFVELRDVFDEPFPEDEYNLGIYNPEIDQWVKLVHEAGGLCFYDHANFNGVMGLTRARDIGFDACMYMLHKTFGASKGGMGPAAGAYGCAFAGERTHTPGGLC